MPANFRNGSFSSLEWGFSLVPIRYIEDSHHQIRSKADDAKLSAVGITLLIIELVYYYPNRMHDGAETGLRIAILLGAMVGQLGAGFLADIYGRRRVYGWELLILLGATWGVTMASRGEGDSMSVYSWRFAWRFFMGIGTSLAISVCSHDVDHQRHRGRLSSFGHLCLRICSNSTSRTNVSLDILCPTSWLSHSGNCQHDGACITPECDSHGYQE